MRSAPSALWKTLSLAALAGCATATTSSQPPPSAPPNFVVIFTDDQRHDAIGYAGNEAIHTPNLDGLAERAVRFSNAFVTLSICSPSRAALLTGRYGSANGVMRLGGTLNEGERVLPQYFQEAGYRTAHVGKWHMPQPPDALGFEVAPYFVSNGSYRERSVVADGRETIAEGFIEDYSVSRAVEFVHEAAAEGEPFLLMLNTQLPHMNGDLEWDASPQSLAMYDPEQLPLPATWDDDLSGKPPYLRTARHREQAQTYGYGDPADIRQHMAEYYAVITDMDVALGRILDELGRPGLLENTYVVFMGDNGWFLGEHGFTSKVLPYEESMRVPLAIAGPGFRPRTEARFALNIDIAPTLLDLAGMLVPETMHGHSLVPVLAGEEVPWRQSFLYQATEPELGSWPHLAVREERWKYIRTFDLEDPLRVAFEELYDLRDDAAEMNNLAHDPEHAEVLQRLRSELERLEGEIQPRP